MKGRILFLTLYDESGASSKVVIYQYLPFFEEAGYACTVRPLIEREAYALQAELAAARGPLALARALARIARLLPKRVLHVMEAWKYDAVVVQKDVLPLGLSRLLALGQKRIIVELDDPIWLAHPASGGNVKFWGRLVAAYRARCLVRLLGFSRLAVVDSPRILDFTKRYCRNGVVLNSSIGLSRYTVERVPSDELGIGWIGSPATTHLLEQAVPWLEKLAAEFPIRLYNIGSSPLRSARLAIENIPWSLESELRHLGRFAVGLMPSDDLEFNLYRFSRKWLHYGAGRVPTLASDNGLNPLVVKDGVNGLLYRAGDVEDFLAQARRLLSDAALRDRLGAAARGIIEREYDLPIVGRAFVSLVESVFAG